VLGRHVCDVPTTYNRTHYAYHFGLTTLFTRLNIEKKMESKPKNKLAAKAALENMVAEPDWRIIYLMYNGKKRAIPYYVAEQIGTIGSALEAEMFEDDNNTELNIQRHADEINDDEMLEIIFAFVEHHFDQANTDPYYLIKKPIDTTHVGSLIVDYPGGSTKFVSPWDKQFCLTKFPHDAKGFVTIQKFIKAVNYLEVTTMLDLLMGYLACWTKDGIKNGSLTELEASYGLSGTIPPPDRIADIREENQEWIFAKVDLDLTEE